LTRGSPAPANAKPAVSVVIASRNENELLRQTVDSFLATLPERSEIVVIDDRSTDGSADFLKQDYHGVRLVQSRRQRGAAAARNYGFGLAKGDVVVFSDAHVELPEGWLAGLEPALAIETAGIVATGQSSMSDPRRRGFGHTWKPNLGWSWLPRQERRHYPVPFASVAFVAARRDVFRKLGGFDPGILIWGSIGDELCLRQWLRGYECLMVPDVVVGHVFRERHPYEIDWKSVLHNQMRMAVLHMSPDRVAALLHRLAGRHGFEPALAHLLAGDAWRLREHYRGLRVRDDDWFFDQFGIELLTDTPVG
jgi:glycosyltransferase involved in cell wall biosynthesis